MSNGGLIGFKNTPSTTSASGVWSIREQIRAQRGVSWPGSFTPVSLFEAGDFGAFYDFSNTSTLFQDTSGTSPVTTDGQSIFRANDLSGNTNNLTASNAPVWDSSGWASFDGTNDFLTTAISRTITDFTIVIGSQETTRQNSILYSLVSGLPNPGRLSAHIPWSDGNYYFDTYNTTSGQGRVSGAATVSTGTPVVTSHSRNGSTVSIRTNGSAFGSGSVSNSISATVIQLGADVYYHNGKISSFFFIDRALSSSDLQLVEDWMAERNGAY